MTVREMAARLGCEIVQDQFEDSEVAGGYTSDLLSDVMAHAKAGDVLITIQSHKNTVAVRCGELPGSWTAIPDPAG
jgi:hypothetical protein